MGVDVAGALSGLNLLVPADRDGSSQQRRENESQKQPRRDGLKPKELEEVLCENDGENLMSEIENNIGNLINVVQRETLRTRLLFALDQIYPKSVTTDILHGVDKEMAHNVIDRELAYLEEKELIKRESPRAGNFLKNRITARGRDFLDGHIKEIGLAAPEMFGEK